MLDSLMPKDAAIRHPFSSIPSRSARLLHVPKYVQLNTYNCGLVAVRILVETFCPSKEARFRLREMDTTKSMGTSDKEVLSTLKGFGIVTDKKRKLSFGNIKKSINAGYPLLTSGIVLEVDEDGDPVTQHWAVIYGYDLEGNIYVSNSSYTAFRCKTKIPWEDFSRHHLAMNHFWECGYIPPKKPRSLISVVKRPTAKK